jgi:hypothetical protein
MAPSLTSASTEPAIAVRVRTKTRVEFRHTRADLHACTNYIAAQCVLVAARFRRNIDRKQIERLIGYLVPIDRRCADSDRSTVAQPNIAHALQRGGSDGLAPRATPLLSVTQWKIPGKRSAVGIINRWQRVPIGRRLWRPLLVRTLACATLDRPKDPSRENSAELRPGICTAGR